MKKSVNAAQSTIQQVNYGFWTLARRQYSRKDKTSKYKLFNSIIKDDNRKIYYKHFIYLV